MQKLAIVVPCYNEEETLNYSVNKLSDLLDSIKKENLISSESKIILVNDGSKDSTWEIMKELLKNNSFIQCINLANNVGHQKALYAGLIYSIDNYDFTISIDADLQDDIKVMPDMIKSYYEGNDIVLGVRSSREKDSFFKRFSAQSFYNIMNKLGVKTVYNHADYRLMSRRSVIDLSKYNEKNLFLRGIITLIGYKQSVVYYEREERLYGESKYPLKKMISFAFDGITSFSIKPLVNILILGLLISFISFITLIISIINNYQLYLIISTITLLGGIIISSIGLIGFYIGKMYIESKDRPLYSIESVLEVADNYDE